MKQEDEPKKNALLLGDLLYPFIRFVVSFVFIVQIIHQIFFMNTNVQIEYYGIALINFSLIIFHVAEGIQELKGKFLLARYFRISSVFIESIIIGKIAYSSFILLQLNEKDNFDWLNIIQQSVFALLILVLLIKDFSRIKEDH